MIYIKATGIFNSLFWQYKDTEQVKALIFFVLGIIICMVIPYLLGSLNASIIVSKYLYHDDIRNYGSGNAGGSEMFPGYSGVILQKRFYLFDQGCVLHDGVVIMPVVVEVNIIDIPMVGIDFQACIRRWGE